VKVLGRVSVFPVLPARLARLQELAHNLWWCWSPGAQALFSGLDHDLWVGLAQNPVKLLARVSQARLDAAAQDPNYLAAYEQVLADFDAYLADGQTWMARTHPDLAKRGVAYFSAEFGLHEALPIYSGGLGVLSGDHTKSASDLGLNFTGVGLLYNQGYFRQVLRPDGMQEAHYDRLNFGELPIEAAQGEDGRPVIVHVELPGRLVFAKVWRVRVGRVQVLLLDTDIEQNSVEDRQFSAQLYGGDHDMRISQEILLGIGGVRAIRALGLDPAVWHMNEGHSAFLGLERIRELVVQQGLSFQEALEAVAANAVFTTHTPVPAGNDAFPFALMEKYFGRFYPQLGIGRDEFLMLARQDVFGGPALFSLSVLALRLSRQANGVSALHGVVSRRMWQDLWPGVPQPEVPITSITNGVHTETWVAAQTMGLYAKAMGPSWREHLSDAGAFAAIQALPDGEVWAVRKELKRQMVDFIRARLAKRRLAAGETAKRVADAERLLDPDALTIGFARRFATYKRATLLFRDMERLARICQAEGRKVQFVFAGKSHPADEPGKSFIQRVAQFAKQAPFDQHVVFIEDYDMNVARHLVTGVDVWLNNPRRPLEASGTSGQKAAMNGVLNLSILDGWWAEGCQDGVNGWAIGDEREFVDQDEQDASDAESLYRLLEEEVVPRYYHASEDGVPHAWVAMVKAAIATCSPVFSTHRMVQDYINGLYLPAMAQGDKLAERSYGAAKGYAEWKRMVAFNWRHVSLNVAPFAFDALTLGESRTVEAILLPGGLDPNNLRVELCMSQEGVEGVAAFPMRCEGPGTEGGLRYLGELQPPSSGTYHVGVRVLPQHPAMKHPQELGLVAWA
jgi:starch phosphorylase